MLFRKILFSLLLVLSFRSNAFAEPNFETKNFAPIDTFVKTLLKTHETSQVLLVLDLDNTLLAMKEPLGSDQWFGWQVNLLQTPTREMEQVASSFAGLLDIQKELFEWGAMRPTDRQASKIIQRFQDQGLFAMVLTSRGPVLQKVTERELEKGGFDFSRNPPAPQFDRPWLPSQTKETFSLSENERRRFGLDDPRPVIYANGVFLTSGQNKGAMLRILLNDLKLDEQFRAIVFVDDHKNHLLRMQEAFKPFVKVQLTTFHFIGEKPAVEQFEKEGKEKVHRAFEQFKKRNK